jgi:membrane-bound lytic murein transglycosylase B
VTSLLVTAALATCLVVPGASAQDLRFNLKRPEIAKFIADFSAANQQDPEAVRAVLAQAVSQPKIIEAMSKPAEKALPWWQYRARFITPERIEAGAALWRAHRELLDAIAVEHGVEPEYLVAIVGVETSYGRITGRYRVLDALATLAFDYPARAEYFRKELGEYLLLIKSDHMDPLHTQGSYAGAMGAAQFMPSSYRSLAVNEGRSAQRDLWNDWGDIFGSVANYFHSNGWQYGAPVLQDAPLKAGTPPLTPPATVNLDETVASLGAKGLQLDGAPAPATAAALIAAPLESGDNWRVGYKNFYVITRYNRSPLYAMAVQELAQAVRQRVLEDQSR